MNMRDSSSITRKHRPGAASGRQRSALTLVLLVTAVVAAADALRRTAADNAPKDHPMENPPQRPLRWAQPLEVEGAPNLHRVSDALFRGAQPTAEGMARLKRLGVKTLLNLRSFHSDRKEAEHAGLRYEHLYMKAWHPEEKELVHFLRLVTAPEHTPVFVHCQHGADRTGTLCAVYRIVVQGWSKAEALEEMLEGGFGYHRIWVNLPAYIDGLDIADLRNKAGLPPLETPGSEAPSPVKAAEKR